MAGRSSRAYLLLNFGDIKVTTLLDTGAARSILDKEVFLDICSRTGRAPLLKPTPSLHSVTGQSLELMGEAELWEEQLGRVTFVIATGVGHYCILGNDLLAEAKAVINLGAGILSYKQKDITLFSADDIANVGKIDNQVKVPAKSSPWGQVLSKSGDLFTEGDNPIGKCDLMYFPIETEGDPIHQRPYRTPLRKRKLIEEEIKCMLKDGIIRPSSSPWASPVTLVPKKDGTTRFCIDFRRLNAVTKKDKYPLPLIQDIFDQLSGASIFSTLDLKSGYWQIPVRPKDIEKTAFVCHVGQFEFLRLPFGLCNAPSAFQRLMNKVLAGLLGKTCMVYLDDIVVFSKDPVEHGRHLAEVFDRLRKAGLTLKRSKCSFGRKEVELLGYLVSGEGIRPDPEKVKAILNLAPATEKTEVRSFLGMTGYYRQCIEDYAKIAEPLIRLTRDKEPFYWGEDQEYAFNKLKQMLTNEPVMAYPRVDRPYKLYTDACTYAVGAILVQEDDQGVERVIQYVSHQLAGSQLEWPTIEKEAYAVVYAIGKLRPYLYGAEFTVHTDHKPLLSLFTKQMKNTKIQRWAVLLAEYGAKIKYRKGSNNIRADMLSRIRSQEVSTIDTDTWFDADFAEDEPDQRIPVLQGDLDRSAISQEQRETMKELYEEASNPDSDYEINQELLYSTRQPHRYAAVYPRLMVPPSLRKKIVETAHVEMGHMSSQKTLDRIREAYLWPGMKADVRKYCFHCPVCSVHTRAREHCEMGEMPIPAYPMQYVSADLTGPLVQSDNGNSYILSIIDHLSGWAEAYPLPNKTNEAVWKVFREEFFPRHGFVETLLTDNGREFTAGPFEEYLKGVGVKHKLTTAYRPQCNGRSERFNRTLKSMLTRLINGKRPAWETELPNALMAYRTAVSTVTGHTPFHLLYGRRSRIPLTRMLQPPTEEYARLFGSRLDELSTALTAAASLTADARKYNRERLAKKANAQDLAIGDTVVVAANEPLTLTAKWDHQYEVIRIQGTTHWIRNQTNAKVIKVHRDKLRLVDPEAAWDEVPVRERRTRAQVVLRPEAPDFVPKQKQNAAQQTSVPPRAMAKRRLGQEPNNEDIDTRKRTKEPEPVPSASTDTQTEALASSDAAQQTLVPPRVVLKRQAGEWSAHIPDTQPKLLIREPDPPSVQDSAQQTQVPQRLLFKRRGGAWRVNDPDDHHPDHQQKQKRIATICWHCRLRGHIKKKCPQRKA